MADDLGYGDLSCYSGWIETPAIDSIAAAGVRFTDFHSSGNVCSPTRAGLMTGRYQQRAGIPGVIVADTSRDVHLDGLQIDELTFADVLREHGYQTGAVGKWHLGYEPKYNPIHNGFDQFIGYVSGNVDFFSHIDQAGNEDWWHQDQLHPEEGYSTHLITQHAVEFIREHQQTPFCLYVAHEAPHYPYQGPDDQPLRTIGGRFSNQGSRSDIRQAYTEMVQEMDKGVGQIRDTLRELDLHENTIVFFFSDNGANARGSNGPWRGNKGQNWEGGHRVPCVVEWPGHIEPQSVSDALTISLDILPTLLDAANIDLPAERLIDGESLLPKCADSNPVGDRKLYWNGLAARHGNWKLVVTRQDTPRARLFDLATDPGESTDVSEEHPEQLASMLQDLAQWKEEVELDATPQPSQRQSD